MGKVINSLASVRGGRAIIIMAVMLSPEFKQFMSDIAQMFHFSLPDNLINVVLAGVGMVFWISRMFIGVQVEKPNLKDPFS